MRKEHSITNKLILSFLILSVISIILIFVVYVLYSRGEGKEYSMLTYFIAYKVIDIVMEGLNSSKAVRIISDKSYEIGQALIDKLDVGITYLYGQGGYSKKEYICLRNTLRIWKRYCSYLRFRSSEHSSAPRPYCLSTSALRCASRIRCSDSPPE